MAFLMGQSHVDLIGSLGTAARTISKGLPEEESVYRFTASSNDPCISVMKSASESSLVQAAQSGGHGAYEELWGRHRK